MSIRKAFHSFWHRRDRKPSTRQAARRRFLFRSDHARALFYEPLESRLLLACNIVASKADALAVDVDIDGATDPGDTLGYTVDISNTGDANCTGVSLSDNEDANTTLVGSSVKITPIAFDDSYNLTGNTPITINAASGVLARSESVV